MKKRDRIVDRLVAEAIGDGDVSHLPGAGKKLPLQDDGSAPEDMRVAFKIMRDHHVKLEWIETGARLAQMERALRNEAAVQARKYVVDLRRAEADGSPARARRVESTWKRFQEELADRIQRYNREALNYNLSLPAGLPHKPTLEGEALLRRALDQAGK